MHVEERGHHSRLLWCDRNRLKRVFRTFAACFSDRSHPPMSITTDNLAEFVDRLTDLKAALAQLNGAGTADKHLLGVVTVATAARALFDDDKQTTALSLFADPSVDADMEPMIETGNGG